MFALPVSGTNPPVCTANRGIFLRHVIFLGRLWCIPQRSVRSTEPGHLRSDRSREITATTHKTPARRPAATVVLLATAVLALVAPPGADARTAEELFTDGNRLFRDDLYWAALLRYRQAAEAGMDSALLHYNTGIAHYKAGQFDRARYQLEAASESSRLEVLAHYNLGLNAWAAGANDEALSWFRLARDQGRNPEISRLATIAISRVQRDIIIEEPTAVREQAQQHQPRRIADFEFRARVSGGSDSNVFRTPAEPYVDLSDPNQPVVDPVVQSGFFVPVSMSARYSVNNFDNESFFGAYRFGGRFYQDKALSNADEHVHELSVGSTYHRKSENRERKLYAAFTIAQHDEVYYDRDNGGVRTVTDPILGELEIGERLDYRRYGPEFWFRQSWSRLSLGGRGKAQLWNYEDTLLVPPYDHEYMLLGLNAQYRFTRTSLLRVTADVYRRHFGQRPSFELDGTQPIGNPPVEYDYQEYGITARQRITRSMWFGLNYVRTDRVDGHLGYNSYTRNGYGFEYHLGSKRFDLEASGIYQVYDYQNAFAFHNPVAGPKTLERVQGSLIASWRMAHSLTLVGEVRYDDVASNDTRLAYNRMQYVLGVRWESQ